MDTTPSTLPPRSLPLEPSASIFKPEHVVDEELGVPTAPAVQIQNVSKAYKSLLSNPKPVLHDITLEIKRGTICGLLGPSGCGKTTLLNCIVGKMLVDTGSILLFGHPTGSKESGVPGRNIGFMPQEISLSFDLKIGETLHFYGNLFGMSSAAIAEKSDFLMRLLEFPELDRFIESLSGGQQRKISLAITLIHDPPLLILDEPTVGVDPIIRKRIWEYLYELASCSKHTIIITTHYIEEAVMADTVEMMYDGKIICEGPPYEVIQRNNCSSLEAVFLKLCLKLDRRTRQFQESEKQEQTIPLLSSGKRVSTNKDVLAVEMTPLSMKREVNNENSDDGNVVNVVPRNKEALELPRISFADKSKMLFRLPKYHRLRALTLCNLRKAYRHVGHFVIHVIVPSIILTVFQLTFGGFPRKIPMAVINDDTEDLGAAFLSHLDPENVVIIPYDTYDEGRHAVEIGDTWGVLQVQANFSDALLQSFQYPDHIEMLIGGLAKYKCPKVMYGASASEAALNYSSIRLALDVTCHPVTMVIMDTLQDAFIKFGLALIKGTGLEPGIVSSPLTFNYDIYPRNTDGLMGFASPGIIMCGIYFVAMANCILSLLSDKSCGQFLRNIVAGATELELVLGHIFAFSVAVFFQTITYIVMAFYILQIPSAGPVYSIFLLVFLHGVCGVGFGLCVSTFCTSEFTAIMLGFGTFLPSVCLSGVVWPIESIPIVMQPICRLLPQSYVIDSLRGIMARGWKIYHPVVAIGFASNLICEKPTYGKSRQETLPEWTFGHKWHFVSDGRTMF